MSMNSLLKTVGMLELQNMVTSWKNWNICKFLMQRKYSANVFTFPLILGYAMHFKYSVTEFLAYVCYILIIEGVFKRWDSRICSSKIKEE
jgi:hypothetical protein